MPLQETMTLRPWAAFVRKELFATWAMASRTSALMSSVATVDVPVRE